MKITDDMLSAQAAEARELWLQACTPDALPEHRFSRKFRREMRRLVRAQKHSAAFNRSLRLARRTAAVLMVFHSMWMHHCVLPNLGLSIHPAAGLPRQAWWNRLVHP